MGLLNGFMVYLFRTNLNMTLPSMVKSTSDDVTNDVNVMLHNHTNETYGVGSGYTKYYEGEECAKVSKKDIDEPRVRNIYLYRNWKTCEYSLRY